MPEVERALGKRDYAAALTRLATLRPAVDAFFDGVMVNAEDAACAQPACAALAAAPAVHAHRGSVLPAGLTSLTMQWLASIVFALFMAVWSISFGLIYCIVCPFLSFKGRFWMAGWLTHPVFFALEWLCGLTYTVEGRENLPRATT